MKKIYLFLVFVAALAMASCEKQEEINNLNYTLPADTFYQCDWVGTIDGEFCDKEYSINIGLRFGTIDGYCVAMDDQELPDSYTKWAGITYELVDNVLSIDDGANYTNIYGNWKFERKQGDDYIFTRQKYTKYEATLTIRRDN